MDAEFQNYVGMNLYRFQKQLAREYPSLPQDRIEITYIESPLPRFTIIGIEKKDVYIYLHVASGNPITSLPTNYQNNHFLREFLMIFQHILNSTTLTLDNMHDYFRPMNSPVSFLPVLSEWLGIHLDALGGEEEVRRFLQHAIPLYRFRGTAIGLKVHLAIITGIVPSIIEGKAPYPTFVISNSTEITAHLVDSEDEKNSFTVYFPVFSRRFGPALIKRLSLIIQREKPVHTKAYLAFKKSKRDYRVITTIDTSTRMDEISGISI
jgi:phage tail-like protein